MLLVITMPYPVKLYMTKEVPTIEENVSVAEAAKVMSRSGRGFLIVLKEGRSAGMVTEHDFVSKVIARELSPATVLVAEIMSSPLITIDPDEELTRASELMQKHNIRRLPVVKDGIMYGVITTREIAKHVGEYVDRSIRDIMKWSFRPF